MGKENKVEMQIHDNKYMQLNIALSLYGLCC